MALHGGIPSQQDSNQLAALLKAVKEKLAIAVAKEAQLADLPFSTDIAPVFEAYQEAAALVDSIEALKVAYAGADEVRSKVIQYGLCFEYSEMLELDAAVMALSNDRPEISDVEALLEQLKELRAKCAILDADFIKQEIAKKIQQHEAYIAVTKDYESQFAKKIAPLDLATKIVLVQEWRVKLLTANYLRFASSVPSTVEKLIQEIANADTAQFLQHEVDAAFRARAILIQQGVRLSATQRALYLMQMDGEAVANKLLSQFNPMQKERKQKEFYDLIETLYKLAPQKHSYEDDAKSALSHSRAPRLMPRLVVVTEGAKDHKDFKAVTMAAAVAFPYAPLSARSAPVAINTSRRAVDSSSDESSSSLSPPEPEVRSFGLMTTLGVFSRDAVTSDSAAARHEGAAALNKLGASS